MTRRTDARQQLQVGTLRQNQLSHTYGVGAMADLPNLSVITLGLDFWKLDGAKPVPEDRLLAAVRAKLGPQIKNLYLPPYKPEKNGHTNEEADVGVPVGLFPSFLRCTACGLLGRPTGGNFELKPNPYSPGRTRYVHLCEKDKKNTPLAVPARFVLACNNGHLDDFPWQYFVHRGQQPEGKHALTLHESGTTGEAADVWVSCTDEGCTRPRQMSDAFGDAAAGNLPACRGRHPHLKTFEPCDQPVRTLALGATNSWFPLRLSSITLPQDNDSLDELVAEHSEQLNLLQDLDEEKVKELLPKMGCWPQLEHHGVEAVWEALHRQAEPSAATGSSANSTDLQIPEWEKLAAGAAIEDPEFTTRPEPVPAVAESWLRRVVLVPRLRQVTALYGFTRIDAPEWEVQQTPNERNGPLSSGDPTWVPCAEMRGEGVFLQFDEDRVAEWENRAKTLHRIKQRLIPGYRKWCAQRRLPADDWPGMRYVLLHTFSHALIRQLALESGYSASGITERIYTKPQNPAMAGILLYTAAPDSEGTLGGLVSLGETNRLGNFIERALEAAKLCSSDPLCSEHDPRTHGRLYGSACHACLFASETSCERGNHYLDRALLVDTIGVTGTGLLSD